MASAYVVDELKKNPRVSVEVVNPAEYKLPFPGTEPDAPGARRLQELVRGSTGVVLVTPEYHGSFSSEMKLVIENLGFPSALAGKPVALLGVAAGAIGAIKSLEHLRGVVSHIGGLALPLPVSIAHVQKVIDANGRIVDPEIEKIVRRTATNLLEYVKQNICPAVTLERLLREGQSADPELVTA